MRFLSPLLLTLLLSLSGNLFAQSNEACLETLRDGLIALRNGDDTNARYHDKQFESQCEITPELNSLSENDPHFVALMKAIDEKDEGLFAPKVCLEIIRAYWISFEKNSVGDKTLYSRYHDNCALEHDENDRIGKDKNAYSDLHYRMDLIASDTHIQDIIQRLRETGLYAKDALLANYADEKKDLH